MPRHCIVTDSSVYFPTLTYPGHELVTVIPLQIEAGNEILFDTKDPKDLRNRFKNKEMVKPHLRIPGVEELSQLFQNLSQSFDSVIAIFHSSQLSPLVERANQAVLQIRNPDDVVVIDSQTVGAGLGVLVQAAAKNIQLHQDIRQISLMLRGMLPHIYTVFFLPNFAFLANSGYLDPAQAVVGEILGFNPFYVLETSRMASIQKARNSRQLVEMLAEFVTEFTDLRYIAMFQGYPPYEQEMRSLRERISKSFPDTLLSEHYLSLSILSLLGPRPLGIVVVENFSNS